MKGLDNMGCGYRVMEHRRDGTPWTTTIWIIRQAKDGTELSRQPHSEAVAETYTTLEEAVEHAMGAWRKGLSASITGITYGDSYSVMTHKLFAEIMKHTKELVVPRA